MFSTFALRENEAAKKFCIMEDAMELSSSREATNYENWSSNKEVATSKKLEKKDL